MSVAERLAAAGISLPAVPKPAANYVPARQHGQLVYASGQTPTVDGVLSMTGKLGADVTVEQGQQGTRICALNCLAAIAGVIGDLERVEAVLKLTGYVASAPGFGDQPMVVNGASLLLEEVLGPDVGQHARAAIGVAELPFGAPVEVDLVVAVR